MNLVVPIAVLDTELKKAREAYGVAVAYMTAHPERRGTRENAAQHLRRVEQIELALAILERENNVRA